MPKNKTIKEIFKKKDDDFQSVGEIVSWHLRVNRLSVNEFSLICGISREHLYSIIEGGSGDDFRISTLKKLSIALDVHPRELFNLCS